MRTVIDPPKKDWPSLCGRPSLELEFLDSTVKNIINRVKTSGDDALKELALRYENVKLESLEVSKAEIEAATAAVPEDLKQAIGIAASNIRTFHESQRRDFQKVETTPGVTCWRKAVAIDRAGIYIPGGTAPLFSTVLMLAVPAMIAGCREVILCSPPDKSGNISSAIIYAASRVGITKMFKAGGAQAIAAMAYGTQTIPTVNKIFGPGNQYVTKAKQIVSQNGISIDMPAGPSEVLIVADDQANPSYVAADLLSQAEHGKDSQVVLVAFSEEMVKKVRTAIDEQMVLLPRQEIAKAALNNSLSIVVRSDADAMDFVNEYAPEHLILNSKNAVQLSDLVRNTGSVFIGPWSPESVGDYASGTNHTLPTNGFAKAYSGVSLESFQKYITFQSLTPEGLKKLGPVVETMAVAEDLVGHKQSISIRLKDLR
ncbi:MAG TPA: histidinol dehydrogenase [Cyclobacteriaceae bacterium]|nr:histidinol dehydrogenase [Cyclobacteriaceae bacterium]